MRRAYVFRAYPTRPQEGRSVKLLRDHCDLYNAALEAAWHQFTCILIGKAEEAARRVMLVNPTGTSITCHRCQARCARPRQDTVICPACGRIDADINGAINIASRAGLGSGQAAPAA